jgi:diguanylate cyclase
LRETDFLGRFGGEEFVILMPETSLEASLTVANKVREAVTSAKFHYEGSQVNITVSAGLAALRQDDDTDGVFARADRALLRAKQNGRNRCELGED